LNWQTTKCAAAGFITRVVGGAVDAESGVEKWRLRTTGLMTSCPLVITLNGKADYAGDSGIMN
jgi:hypothetical protein